MKFVRHENPWHDLEVCHHVLLRAAQGLVTAPPSWWQTCQVRSGVIILDLSVQCTHPERCLGRSTSTAPGHMRPLKTKSLGGIFMCLFRFRVPQPLALPCVRPPTWLGHKTPESMNGDLSCQGKTSYSMKHSKYQTSWESNFQFFFFACDESFHHGNFFPYQPLK